MQTVTGIQVQQFRKLDSYVLPLDEHVTLIQGVNGSGKTSLIEGLYLAATGESFRAGKIEEMVAFGQEMGRVQVKLEKGSDEDVALEVAVTRGVVQGKKTQKRLFTVNGVRRRRASLLGNLYAVVFRPEDMRLVEGSPARRRDFLDRTLCMLWPDYGRALKQYGQALIRYNKLLQAVREREQPPTVLQYWEQTIITTGSFIQKLRSECIAHINTVEFVMQLECVYQQSVMSKDRVEEYRARAIAAGHALVGPHKDDFQVLFTPEKSATPEDMAVYGSRGQQRLAVLWLKLAELSYIRSITDQSPLLLLDDIFSELDADNGQIIIDLIRQHQTVVTTAYPETVLPLFDEFSIKSVTLQ